MIQLIIGIVLFIASVGLAISFFVGNEELRFYGYMSLLMSLVAFSLCIGAPLPLQSERGYLEDIPNQNQLYELNQTEEENTFTYYDGNVQQTLSGEFKLKIYYKEDLKQPYAEIKYNVTLRSNLFKSDNLQDYDIENIDVYLKKE